MLSEDHHPPRLTAFDALALLIIAIASIIGINQYAYGLYNHFITIPFIKSTIQPELYPHDYLIAEKVFLYTYFISGIAWLAKILHAPLPALYFALYGISLYFTLVAFFKIALTLYPKKEVAYFSVIFLIFSFATLGDIRTIDSLFLERTLVLPILLYAFYFFLHKKIVGAYALSGIAFLFHPLSALYALACLFICCVFSLKELGWKKVAIGLAVLVAVASPVLYLKAVNPAPSLGLFRVDPGWLELLRLRSSHHLFPTAWSPFLIMQTALFIAGFGLCRIHQPAPWHHRVVMLSSAAVLMLCVAGTVFTEVVPVAVVLQFQLFRSFVFLIFFAIIYYSNFFFEEMKSGNCLLQKIMVFLFFVMVFYSGNLPKYASFLVVALAVFPGYALAEKYLNAYRKFYMPALLFVVLAIGISGGMLRGTFSIGNKQEKEWLSVQQWARENTPVDAIFIVSPKSEGFRVEAERASYGDWKDGTQMFFNPAFGDEWIRRMKRLGYEDDDRLEETYTALREHDFESIKAELNSQHGSIFIVTSDEKNLAYPQSFSNESYRVYKLK